MNPQAGAPEYPPRVWVSFCRDGRPNSLYDYDPTGIRDDNAHVMLSLDEHIAIVSRYRESMEILARAVESIRSDDENNSWEEEAMRNYRTAIEAIAAVKARGDWPLENS